MAWWSMSGGLIMDGDPWVANIGVYELSVGYWERRLVKTYYYTEWGLWS